MSKAWNKTTISIESKVDADNSRKRSYNNVIEGASDDNVLAFAETIAELTGQETINVTTTTVETLAADVEE